MSSPLSVPLDPIDVAADADRKMWDLAQPHRGQWREIRDHAVKDAIVTGHSREEVAGALGVLPADVDRILLETI